MRFLVLRILSVMMSIGANAYLITSKLGTNVSLHTTLFVRLPKIAIRRSFCFVEITTNANVDLVLYATRNRRRLVVLSKLEVCFNHRISHY